MNKWIPDSQRIHRENRLKKDKKYFAFVLVLMYDKKLQHRSIHCKIYRGQTGTNGKSMN